MITVNLAESMNTVRAYARQYSYLFLLDSDLSTWNVYKQDPPPYYIPLNLVIDNDQNMTVAFWMEGFNEATIRYYIEQCLLGVEEQPEVVSQEPEAGLYQNSPNPFGAGGTTIQFSISNFQFPISLGVYDISGKLVRTLVDERREPGRHTVRWDGKDWAGEEVASGIYFYRLTVGDYSVCKKLTVLR